MKRIASILRGTQGIFVQVLEKRENCFSDASYSSDGIPYLEAVRDKLNLQTDMYLLCNDFRNATEEAKNRLNVR